MKTERVTIRLGPELQKAAQEAAYEQEMRLGEFIRWALAEYLRRENGDETDE